MYQKWVADYCKRMKVPDNTALDYERAAARLEKDLEEFANRPELAPELLELAGLVERGLRLTLQLLDPK